MRSAMTSTVLVLTFFFCPGMSAAAQHSGQFPSAGIKRTHPRITVRIYNYAEVPAATLTETEHEAELVFHRAGIDVAWALCPADDGRPEDYPSCLAKYGPNDFIIRLLPAEMEARVQATKETFGFTIPCPRDAKVCFADVLSERTKDWASQVQAPFSRVLSRIIAHELGHMLMPKVPHSATGIMRAVWRPDDFVSTHGWGLFFTHWDAVKLRAELARREDRRRNLFGFYPLAGYRGRR